MRAVQDAKTAKKDHLEKVYTFFVIVAIVFVAVNRLPPSLPSLLPPKSSLSSLHSTLVANAIARFIPSSLFVTRRLGLGQRRPTIQVVALSSPAAARRLNAWRWLVVAFSAKQKQQLHHQQLTNGSTILLFTLPVNLDLFYLPTVSF